MKLEDVQSNNRKDIVMTIRTTREKSRWMKEHNVRPSLLFDKALEELMELEKDKGKEKK